MYSSKTLSINHNISVVGQAIKRYYLDCQVISLYMYKTKIKRQKEKKNEATEKVPCTEESVVSSKKF